MHTGGYIAYSSLFLMNWNVHMLMFLFPPEKRRYFLGHIIAELCLVSFLPVAASEIRTSHLWLLRYPDLSTVALLMFQHFSYGPWFMPLRAFTSPKYYLQAVLVIAHRNMITRRKMWNFHCLFPLTSVIHTRHAWGLSLLHFKYLLAIALWLYQCPSPMKVSNPVSNAFQYHKLNPQIYIQCYFTPQNSSNGPFPPSG